VKYRKLGASELEVSETCLGAMTNSEAEGHQQVDYATGQGVNFFDAAEIK
jgi:aryl-alcohol dehydrogenase-like predicted oxidoreductase